MIRRAGFDDIEALVDLGRRFHAASHWHGSVPFSAEDFAESAHALIGRATAAIFVTPDVSGMIAVTRAPLYFNHGRSVVSELFFYGGGQGDALRRAAERWAAAEGAAVVHMSAHLPGPIDRIERWYAHAGYAPYGRSFMKGLPEHG